ncbi:MAG TPA: hypothetical protein VIW24_10845 [Aldersonia sp.]
MYGWQDNHIDERAEEQNDSGKIQTHSDYPLCLKYQARLKTPA